MGFLQVEVEVEVEVEEGLCGRATEMLGMRGEGSMHVIYGIGVLRKDKRLSTTQVSGFHCCMDGSDYARRWFNVRGLKIEGRDD